MKLTGQKAFASVLSYKCRADGHLFQVYAMPNGEKFARVGIITSKRLLGGAVRRNYCKRLVREIFRTEGHFLQGTDFVVRARKPVGRQQARAARREIRKLLSSVGQRCQREPGPPVQESARLDQGSG